MTRAANGVGREADDGLFHAQGPLHVRSATAADLARINAVIDEAVMGWSLPGRVKRLALPACRYDPVDVASMQVLVAEHDGTLVGVAALEPGAGGAMLLHGLYVAPATQRVGIGTRLVAAVLERARAAGAATLEVNAQRDAEGFFHARGFAPAKGAPAKGVAAGAPVRHPRRLHVAVSSQPGADREQSRGAREPGAGD